MPPLGDSDHDIVYMNISAKARLNKQKPRKNYSKAEECH